MGLRDRWRQFREEWDATPEPPARPAPRPKPNGRTCSICQEQECVGHNHQCNDCIAIYLSS